ncbi:MAG: RNA polymerase factor sigma-54 [Parachlamydiaceae bacterium]
MSENVQIAAPQLQGGARQEGQLAQRMIMSHQMQQALHLLQLPLQELEPFIEEQVVENPILEISSDQEEDDEKRGVEEISEEETHRGSEEKELVISDKDLSILSQLDEDFRDHFAQSEPSPIKRSSDEDKLKTFLEQSICDAPTLGEILLKQARETFETPQEIQIANILIGYIDELGLLKTPLCEICALHHLSKDDVQDVLSILQTFDPCGVAASSIQESLLIQLRSLHKDKSLAYQIVRDYYDELLHNQIPLIQKKIKCSYEKIRQAIEQDIAKLNLHPGTYFSSEPSPVIIPDVTLRQEGETLIVEVERDYTPSLRLNSHYLKMFHDPDVPAETKHYIKHHILSARWLIRNLQQRFSTIERIAQVLAQKQYAFFTKPDGQLIPLTMKMLAEELDLHESTIARTVSNKYLFSPRGLLPLRAFFTTKYIGETGEDLSATTVKEAILDLIGQEDKKHPLSDDKISTILRTKGIPCARRTVAKYRLMLQIGNTQQRRKFS